MKDLVLKYRSKLKRYRDERGSDSKLSMMESDFNLSDFDSEFNRASDKGEDLRSPSHLGLDSADKAELIRLRTDVKKRAELDISRAS